MNELNARLLEYLPDPNTVKGGMEGVVDALQVEAPLLVGELMKWHFTLSLVTFLIVLTLSIALFVTPFFLIRWIAPKIKDGTCYMHEDKLSLILWVFLMTTIPLTGANLTWLQIWIAPRLFLLEYISNLL